MMMLVADRLCFDRQNGYFDEKGGMIQRVVDPTTAWDTSECHVYNSHAGEDMQTILNRQKTGTGPRPGGFSHL